MNNEDFAKYLNQEVWPDILDGTPREIISKVRSYFGTNGLLKIRSDDRPPATRNPDSLLMDPEYYDLTKLKHLEGYTQYMLRVARTVHTVEWRNDLPLGIVHRFIQPERRRTFQSRTGQRRRARKHTRQRRR